VFDIHADGRLLYSKALTGRIPKTEDVLRRVRQR
jgi:hypothetical protein